METSRLCSKESERLTRSFLDTWSYALSMNKKTFEGECLQLIDLLDNVRLKWKNSEAEKTVYMKRCEEVEKLLKESEKTNTTLQERLVNCQAEISSLITKINANEKELEEYRKKWDLVREKLNDPARDIEHLKYAANTSQDKSQYCVGPSQSIENSTTVSGSLLEPFHVTPRRRVLSPIYNDDEGDNSADFSGTSNSDIDYDKTGDSLETSSNELGVRRISRKRRSRSQVPFENRGIKFNEDVMLRSCPSKRSRNAAEEIVATATINIDPTGVKKPTGSLAINRMKKRSMSESTLTETGSAYGKVKANTATPLVSELRSPAAIASSWTNGQPLERRTHRVVTFWPFLEFCDVCNKRFGLTGSDALRCLDCCIRFHRNCHRSAPMPCVPQVKIPNAGKNQKLPLKCYCPPNHPMIPPLIIYCIVSLEEHRLTREGIYRIPGPDNAVKKLYNEFLTSRVVPNLSNVDTETITGVIKKFLRELKDTLIPTTSFTEFKSAVESNSNEQLEKAIFDLPNANRDTLAYFLHHLQNVAKLSTQNMMPLENLCRVLAPTIVGYSSFVTASCENQELITRTQFAILYKLLKMPQEFWKQFVEKNMTAYIYEERTPRRCLLTPQSSRTNSRRIKLHGTPGDSSPLVKPLNISTRKGAFFEENLL